MKKVCLAACLMALGVASVFADTYDERLEYIETDGTQWADTGVRLHCRNSMFRLRVRVLDHATNYQVLFGGMTEVKDNAQGAWKSFAVGTLPVGYYAGNKTLLSWNEGSNQSSYYYPATGSFLAGGAFTIEGWRNFGWYNGTRQGYPGYAANKPDVTTVNTFYLGACNNAGVGVLSARPEEHVRVHWYRAQFWNNVSNEYDLTEAELIGDFIPVRKGSEVGFFDLVTETFHPSISGVAFTAPERVVWQGGNDGKLTEDANWVGGHAPTESSQVAEFPAGVEVRYPTADIAGFFNNLGGVRLDGADTLLWLTNLNVSGAHNLYAPVYGTGTFRVESKLNSSAQVLKFRADNGAFEGLFDMTNCYTFYCHAYALGACGVGKARYHANFGNIRLYQGVNRLHADLMLGTTGQFVFAPGTTLDGKVSMVTASGGNFHANGSETTVFNCAFEDVYGTRRPLNLTAGYYVFGDETKPKNFGKVQLFGANMTINAPLTFLRPGNDLNITQQGNLVPNAGGVRGLVFGCTNAVSDETFLLLGYAEKLKSRTRNIVNLNGFDQRVGSVGLYTQETEINSSTDWNTNLVITSATPATLTILEAYRYDAKDNGTYNCSVYPGLVRGAASIVLSEKPIVNPSFWSKRMRFNAPGSDTSGSLTAAGGSIEILPTATFPNLTGLVASKTGIVKVRTAAIGTATNLCVMVRDATTAKIDLDAGVTLKADTAFMGTKWLEPGRYSSVASAGVKACPELTGTGILEVENYGGVKGFVLFFH